MTCILSKDFECSRSLLNLHLTFLAAFLGEKKVAETAEERTQWLRTLVAPAEAPFDSQQPHSSSQPPVTPVTGAPVASSGFHRHQALTDTYVGTRVYKQVFAWCVSYLIPVLKRRQQAALSEFEICIANSSLARAVS